MGAFLYYVGTGIVTDSDLIETVRKNLSVSRNRTGVELSVEFFRVAVDTTSAIFHHFLKI